MSCLRAGVSVVVCCAVVACGSKSSARDGGVGRAASIAYVPVDAARPIAPPAPPVLPRTPAPSPKPTPRASRAPERTSVAAAKECEPSNERSCDVEISDHDGHSCTAYGSQSCQVDGRWGPCLARCETRYSHSGHEVYGEYRHCDVTLRCESSYGGVECTEDHDTAAPTRIGYPGSTEPCMGTCSASGGSCSFSGLRTLDSAGQQWSACGQGSCTIYNIDTTINCSVY